MFDVIPVEIFQENIQNPTYWYVSALFGDKKMAKHLAHRGHFTYTQTKKYPQYACKPF